MINKLMSNLSFNPNLVEQLGFYQRRLQRETSVRRLGVVLLVASLLVQIVAASFPAEKSLAGSSNDVIFGGVSSYGQLKAKYNKHADVRALYKRFGLEAADLNNATGSESNFKFDYQGAQGTRTVGRINFSYTKDLYLGKFAGSNFYSRKASEWSGSTSAFYFGKQKGTDGNDYYVWVLKDCGNIAYRPAPPPPDKKPKPENPTPPVVPPPEIPPPPEEVPPPNVVPSKQVVNITRNLSPEATQTTKARPNDVLEYTLTLKNTGGEERKDFTTEDYVGDILDYSDLDMNFLADGGGEYFDKTKKVVWKDQTVKPGETITNVFRVKVKSKIPTTNQPHAMTTQFDCKMQNAYGNEVTVLLECATVKSVETLPNTGPGTTIAVAFGVTVLGGYLFARSRLLSKELQVARSILQSSGGHS